MDSATQPPVKCVCVLGATSCVQASRASATGPQSPFVMYARSRVYWSHRNTTTNIFCAPWRVFCTGVACKCSERRTARATPQMPRRLRATLVRRRRNWPPSTPEASIRNVQTSTVASLHRFQAKKSSLGPIDPKCRHFGRPLTAVAAACCTAPVRLPRRPIAIRCLDRRCGVGDALQKHCKSPTSRCMRVRAPIAR